MRATYKGYARFLGRPWKTTTFVIATLAMVVIAPYTGDPTWDWFDALFMSVATYLTAPWALGVLFLTFRGKRPARHAFLAACAWMFSASWSYDLYILLRDGYYPVTWIANIPAASVLYASAGLLWSLEHVAGRGVVFGFMCEDWPRLEGASGFGRIAWAALPFMAIAALSVLWFVHGYLTGR